MSGPARTVDPNPEAEDTQRIDEALRLLEHGLEFGAWDDRHLDRLLGMHERKSWRDEQIICPARFVRLNPEQRKWVKTLIITAVLTRHDGRYVSGKVAVRTDGNELWTEMK